MWGAIAALSADGLDVVLWDVMPWGGVPDSYHRLDKFPDMYYLGIAFLVSQRRWEALPRRISLALFLGRLLGFLLFEATGERKLLFLFPNVFEAFFIFMSVVTTFPTWYRLSPLRLGVWLAILGTAITVKEYFHHWQRVWDDLVAMDVFQAIGEAVLSWLAAWSPLLLAVLLPAAAATLLMARAGRLGWLRRWLSAQLSAFRGIPVGSEGAD